MKFSMKFNVDYAEPKIDFVETLGGIWDRSFDRVYHETKGPNFEEKLRDQSYILARNEKGEVVAYLTYNQPEDIEFGKSMDFIEVMLEWNKGLLEDDSDLGILVKYCNGLLGLDRTLKNHDIIPFEQGIGVDRKRDCYIEELAVLPEYRRKGIATNLFKKVLEASKGRSFMNVRKGSYDVIGEFPTHNLALELGFVPLFQYGPVFQDGTSYVIMAR